MRLRGESERKNISLNTLANQIITQHTDWHSYVPNSGIIPVWKTILITLLKKYTEKEIRSLAEEVTKRSAKDTVLLIEKQHDPMSILQVIKKWLSVTGYAYTHVIAHPTHKLIVHHDMGKKMVRFSF